MITAWTKHAKTPEEKDQLERSIRHSKWILDHLKTLLNEMEEDLNKVEINPQMYEVPNWDYRQAHNNGARQYLRAIKRLITLDHKDTNDRELTSN